MIRCMKLNDVVFPLSLIALILSGDSGSTVTKILLLIIFAASVKEKRRNRNG